jgi:hypothetical protein
MKICRSALALSLVVSLVSMHAAAEEASFATAEPEAPSASAKQEAARRFEHAVKLYEDADYTLALAEFERVHELVPDYRVLYNIGQVNIQLGRYARALRSLRDYVEKGAGDLPPERREAVQADLDSLAGRTARISVEVMPEGAEIWLDGAFVGKSPLSEPLIVDVGERTVQIRLTGYRAQTQTLTLAGGDARRESFVLEAEQAQVAPPPAVEPLPTVPARAATVPREPPPPRSWTWVGWTATSVLAVSAGVSGALGASAAADLRDLRDTPHASRDALDAASGRAKTRLLVADVLGAAAIATGAVTLYFQLSKPAPRERPRSAFALGFAPSGVALRVEH